MGLLEPVHVEKKQPLASVQWDVDSLRRRVIPNVLGRLPERIQRWLEALKANPGVSFSDEVQGCLPNFLEKGTQGFWVMG